MFRKSCCRPAALVATLIAMAASQAAGQTEAAKTHLDGDIGPGLESLDTAVLNIMRDHHIPGASLAVARNGALVLARGYGWADQKAARGRAAANAVCRWRASPRASPRPRS